MSKKKSTQACCCKQSCGCQQNSCGCNNNGFFGLNGCVTPIIFLLIACGSGLLCSNKSYLIILLFLLCGGSFTSLFGGGDSCCC